MVTYILALLAVALFMGFSMSLQRTSRYIGFKMSYNNKNLGPAISPPWFDKVEMLLVLPLLIFLIYHGYSKYGLLSAVAILVGGLIITLGFKLIIFPVPMSFIYRNFIFSSMVNRHADYVKSGDSVRAEAMKVYIERFTQLGFHSDTYTIPSDK